MSETNNTTSTTTGPVSEIPDSASGSCSCSCCVLEVGQTECSVSLVGTISTGNFGQCKTFQTCSTSFPDLCPSNAAVNIQFRSGPAGTSNTANPSTGGSSVTGTKPPKSKADPSSNAPDSEESNIGLIAGIVGGVIVLLIIVLILFRCRSAKRKQREIDEILYNSPAQKSTSSRKFSIGNMFKSSSSSASNSTPTISSFKVLPPRGGQGTSITDPGTPSIKSTDLPSSSNYDPYQGQQYTQQPPQIPQQYSKQYQPQYSQQQQRQYATQQFSTPMQQQFSTPMQQQYYEPQIQSSSNHLGLVNELHRPISQNPNDPMKFIT